MQQDPTLQVAHLHWSPKSSPKDTDPPTQAESPLPPVPSNPYVFSLEQSERES